MNSRISRVLITAVAVAALVTMMGGSQPASASEPFLGQIEYYGFNFPPRGWALCDGQLLPINQNQSLFSLLGTTFGGDGRTTFALPDMRGRIPVHDGGSAGTGLTRRPLGSRGGEEQNTLTQAELPSHTHTLRGTTAVGNHPLPVGKSLADDSPDETYSDSAPDVAMNAGSIAATPSQGHENMPLFQVISCNIALTGLFPSRN